MGDCYRFDVTKFKYANEINASSTIFDVAKFVLKIKSFYVYESMWK